MSHANRMALLRYMQDHPLDRSAIKIFADALMEDMHCTPMQAYRVALITHRKMHRDGFKKMWNAALRHKVWYQAICEWCIRHHPAADKLSQIIILLTDTATVPRVRLYTITPRSGPRYGVVIAYVYVGVMYLARHAHDVIRVRQAIAQRGYWRYPLLRHGRPSMPQG